MLLQIQLSTIHMSKTNTMVSYLTRISVFRDQLVAIGTKVEDQKIVSVSL